MKANKVIFVLLLPFVIEVFISCCFEEPIVYTFVHTKMEVVHVDNSRKSPAIAISDSVLKTSYGIRINIDREMYAHNSFQNLSVFTSSYATSCGGYFQAFIPREYMIDLKIISLHNFDSTHLAGDDISSYFKVYKEHSYQSIAKYLEKEEKDFVYEHLSELKIELLLMTPPALSKLHEFKVQLFLSDGRVLEYTTTPIYLI